MTGRERKEPTKARPAQWSQQTRVLVALFVTWALASSMGLGWLLTIQQQQEQRVQQEEGSLHTAVAVLVYEIGGAFVNASASGRSLLSGRSLSDAWSGTVWMTAAANLSRDLYDWVADGDAVVYELNLLGLDCVARRYAVMITELATTGPTALNGTNAFTRYFGLVADRTLDLGNELESIAEVSGHTPPFSNVLDRMNTPTADSIRADAGALYLAGVGSSPDQWRMACVWS
jgi:hypothetical protein